MEMDHKIKTYAGDKPVFFSGLNYRPAVPFHHPNELGQKVILVTGIANTKALAAHVSTHFELLKHLRYVDHHQYTIFDIERIEAAARQLQADVILTTEKDWVKLKSAELMAAMSSKKWFYLPIETEFINCGAEFDAMVKLLVESRLHELERSTEG